MSWYGNNKNIVLHENSFLILSGSFGSSYPIFFRRSYKRFHRTEPWVTPTNNHQKVTLLGSRESIVHNYFLIFCFTICYIYVVTYVAFVYVKSQRIEKEDQREKVRRGTEKD